MRSRTSRAIARRIVPQRAALLAFGVLGAALAVLAAPALSQSLDVSELRELDDDNTSATYEDLTVDELEDMDLVRDGEVIGEVEEVLADEDGEIVALVIEYGGNAVGIGDREVVLPVDDIEIPAGRDEIETTLSDEELGELTTWNR